MSTIGFWSYARDDDNDLGKALSNLRVRIERRVRVVSGTDVSVFQDIADIRTGDNWRERLELTLNSASFLVPIVTPRFLNSEWCREEVETFCEAAIVMGQEPMLFPIYFIKDRRFDTDRSDSLIQRLRAFQYFDFRELQFETEERIIEREVHKLAEAIELRLHALSSQHDSPGNIPRTPGQSSNSSAERQWKPGDKKPTRVRFVGFPQGAEFTMGEYVEGKLYQIGKFDGDADVPFQVIDEQGSPLWVSATGFRVVS
jgi:TIR domain